MLQDIGKALERFREAAKRNQEQEQTNQRASELQIHAEPPEVPRVQELHRTALPIIGQGKR